MSSSPRLSYAPATASVITSVPTSAVPKRTRHEQLRAELEAARIAFHALLESHSGDRWRKPSRTTAWSCGEVLEHLTWAVEYLPKEVESARQGRGMFNAPKLLAGLVNTLSYCYVRWMTRSATPASIRQRYDQAIDATLRVLDTIREDEWTKGADFYGEGFHSIEQLFRTPSEHLNAHTKGWDGR